MTGRGAFAKLRRVVRREPATTEERCDLCASTLPQVHDHLVEPEKCRIWCSCAACARLVPARKEARFKRVPRRVKTLFPGPAPEELWASLDIPVTLAFFVRRSQSGQVDAFFPRPAGPMPASVDADSWQRAMALCPALKAMESDVEALLLHGSPGVQEAYVVPIDTCFLLIGSFRIHWEGLSGGDRVRQDVDEFFGRLRERARAGSEGISHA